MMEALPAAEFAAVALVQFNASSKAISATAGGIPISGAGDDWGGGGSTAASGLRLRGQYFHTSSAMTATTATGNPTMSASCSVRHSMSRLPTEPTMSASATARMKVL